MEVEFGIGMNSIYFGMLEADVIEILGNPTKKYFDDNEDLYLVYYDICTKFRFDKDDDYKLFYIDSSSDDISIFGKKLLRVSKEDVLRLLNSNGYSDFEWEDYDYFDVLYCEDISLWITFEYDRTTGIEFFPLYDKDGDTVLWPKIPQRSN